MRSAGLTNGDFERAREPANERRVCVLCEWHIVLSGVVDAPSKATARAVE